MSEKSKLVLDHDLGWIFFEVLWLNMKKLLLWVGAWPSWTFYSVLHCIMLYPDLELFLKHKLCSKMTQLCFCWHIIILYINLRLFKIFCFRWIEEPFTARMIMGHATNNGHVMSDLNLPHFWFSRIHS